MATLSLWPKEVSPNRVRVTGPSLYHHQNVKTYRKRLSDWKREEPSDPTSWRSPRGEAVVRGVAAGLSANKIPEECDGGRGQCVRRV